MKSPYTHFIDTSFEGNETLASSNYYSDLVEVHLRSHDEAWIHSFKTDLLSAHYNLKDSLKEGILPDIKTSFFLSNEELKTYYSENDDTQMGIEVIQTSIDMFLKQVDSGADEVPSSSIEEIYEKCLSERTFIPSTKATGVVSDIVSI
jgi:hypothetical protein